MPRDAKLLVALTLLDCHGADSRPEIGVTAASSVAVDHVPPIGAHGGEAQEQLNVVSGVVPTGAEQEGGTLQQQLRKENVPSACRRRG